MVKGHEMPPWRGGGGKIPGSCGAPLSVEVLLLSSQILFLALAPLSSPIPLLAVRSAAVNASDSCLLDPACI